MWRWIWIGLSVVVLAALAALALELRYAWLQAHWISEYAERLSFQVADGPSEAIRFPQAGPFNARLGYSLLPGLQLRLQQQGYAITRQARFSPELLAYAGHGLYVPYAEKTQAGLLISDYQQGLIYQYRYPRARFDSFAEVPPLLIEALLFIENRHLLDTQFKYANPAVDWPRLAGASMAMLSDILGSDTQVHGASTLATQMEKFRHSFEGRTQTPADKLRQMASASVRGYQQGPDTLEARKQLVLDYLNSVPLTAAPGYGEVHGVSDALWVWFAQPVEDFCAALNGQQGIAAQGRALRQALALIVAQRRPSWYLLAGRRELNSLIDSHIRLLAEHQRIHEPLAAAALQSPLVFRDWQLQPVTQQLSRDKSVRVTRNQLANVLGQSLYALDRLDLQAVSTLDIGLQNAVSEFLEGLADETGAHEAGLVGDSLLSAQQASQVRYSFTLMERTATGNQVRVQTDTTGLPFDLNEGSKLELGSTAKLRVLTSYLEIIAELHAGLLKVQAQLPGQGVSLSTDPLTQWASSYLRAYPDSTLEAMLEAALQRRYSASPGEAFFTGGGVQHFNNFSKHDDRRLPTVQEALQESINLPFVRLLRDVIRYSLQQEVADAQRLLNDDRDPRRTAYLQTFADREGRVYLQRFWRRYAGMDEQQRLLRLVGAMQPVAARLAVVHRLLYPEADLEQFQAFMHANVRVPQQPERIERLYAAYAPDKYSLTDQGYIAKVHPLELWLLRYMREQPQATLNDVLSASAAERQAVYAWLFRTRHASARTVRIRTMLERQAFAGLHQRWQRVGYPFASLVPSLGTALGSSGDRPGALAELMGIIVNDGQRLTVQRISSLHFAERTPWETRFEPALLAPQQVLQPEVAAALRRALSAVVLDGTGRRLQGVFMTADGEPLAVGGKTGTGDNRIHTVTASGVVTSSAVMDRTATFVFFVGPRHFGTLTAFVPGEAAGQFHFTSALPAQVLKSMGPVLTPYLKAPVGEPSMLPP